MQNYPIHIGSHALTQLQEDLARQAPSSVLVLVDEHTRAHCYPLLQPLLPEHALCEIRAGEIHKNLQTCSQIWQDLTDAHFDRKGLVINLGGGVIGDMGGFAASTYKRGIAFVQVPTTLLSQVDASVGGKLGIDFHGYKNHIGLFRDPRAVYIYPEFLYTLPKRELRSGFAEVIKHHLIADGKGWESLRQTRELTSLDFEAIIRHSVTIKQEIVDLDPEEKGARKALNFGHTIGHAIESEYLERPDAFLHGEAIAIGMVGEAFIAHQRDLVGEEELMGLTSFIYQHYGHHPLEPALFEAIYQRMINDKKNQDGQILCTLLKGMGTFLINISIERQEVFDALHYYNRYEERSAV